MRSQIRFKKLEPLMGVWSLRSQSQAFSKSKACCSDFL
ncbi:hypothetical protein HPHPP13_0138 [Helicobacter pylori Hp P-13]|uniref:Uncharacterized protein n=1 Tax=Helicobacter pylori Hp P-13b TaxID=992107 RepID=A0ABC9QSR8_HELPX|nr:hypothetical protein HPHPA8_1399 [Helicobacter pylori Hp A-8]EJC09922.1 hypothetical protein HPHPP13_0138 [Helicobacter pylori Hp P-13]EJC33464.1 hypothetical protein HPHPP13B_0135 [Helicobacter pylori Hp P-13b]